jgi:predicted transcriptional regulator
MSSLTIRLPEKMLHEIDEKAQKLHISRTAYIKESIERMNRRIRENEKKARLIEASRRVRKESMLVNSEFAQIEHDPKA